MLCKHDCFTACVWTVFLCRSYSYLLCQACLSNVFYMCTLLYVAYYVQVLEYTCSLFTYCLSMECLQLAKGYYIGPHQKFMFRHMSDTSVFVGLVKTGLASQAPICIGRHPATVSKLVVLDLSTWCDWSCIAVLKASDCTQRALPWGCSRVLCVWWHTVWSVSLRRVRVEKMQKRCWELE